VGQDPAGQVAKTLPRRFRVLSDSEMTHAEFLLAEIRDRQLAGRGS
jgi:hypothetical protein